MDNIFPNRRWLVIPISVTSSIDWQQVQESGPDYLRLSTDKTKTFVKYDVNVITASYTQSYIDPETNTSASYIVEAGTYGRPSIYSGSYPEYTYPEILNILSTPEWTQPMSGSLNPG